MTSNKPWRNSDKLGRFIRPLEAGNYRLIQVKYTAEINPENPIIGLILWHRHPVAQP